MSSFMLDSIQAIVALTSLFVVVIILLLLIYSLVWLRKNFPNLAIAPFFKSYKYGRYQNMALQDDIIEQIGFFERRLGFRLTPEAKQLFVSPIIDAYQSKEGSSRREFDQTWRNSIGIVLDTIARDEVVIEPRGYEYEDGQRFPLIGTITILNAFMIRWCNIPPICRPV